MRNYQIGIANTYNQINAPLIIDSGYYNTKVSGYKCITQLNSTEYNIVPINNQKNIVNINNITVLTKMVGSYTLQLIDPSQADNEVVLFSFYTFQNIPVTNSDNLSLIFNQELPAIYKSNEPYNDIDNSGTIAVLSEVYKTIYSLFFNSISSLGVSGVYNSEWEYVYLGVYNLLENAVYPAEFLKTLMNINTQCSTQRFSTAITISRLIYQFIGYPIPVQIVYNSVFKGYDINIFYTTMGEWSLEVPGYSELGITTILSSGGGTFLWVINKIILKLMPAHVKWRIQFPPITDFNLNFNISDVNSNDFYNPNILYDAYQVINNFNNFNTQGFNLNG